MRSRLTLRSVLWSAAVLGALACVAAAQAAPRTSLAGLRPGEVVTGFRAQALYLDDTGRPMGARFKHLQTGFCLDLLYFDSAPQAFIWVNTPPANNKGEAHTQEHLLVGKGAKARALVNLEAMSLVEDNAATWQWRTCYDFHTVAGTDAFFPFLERYLDALLHPDYEDDEVRREVCNFGVSQDPQTHALRLEEKGTVYNEMVNYENQPWRAYRYLNLALYGPQHPLAQESGGLPEGIRALTPDEIRQFRARCYHLGNMGAMVALPRDVPAGEALARINDMLPRLEPGPQAAMAPLDESTFPPPQPAPRGEVQIVDYPSDNDQQPGPVFLSWPPVLQLSPREETLAQAFIDAFATGATSHLYKLLVDTRTRTLDLGATDISGGVSDDEGQPVQVTLSGVPPAHVRVTQLMRLRQLLRRELHRIATFRGGSAELRQFNSRVRMRLVERRRGLSKFANSPPLFGFRWAETDWLDHLKLLAREPGFRKQVTMRDDLEELQGQVADRVNGWGQWLKRWKLLTETPYIVAARPSPELMKRLADEQEARAAAEAARLKGKYGVSDDQEAIRRYKADYDATSARLEEAARRVPMPPFLAHPPLTLDDGLRFQTTPTGGVPCVAASFEGITSAAVGLSLRLDGVPEDKLVYLALLPQLLINVGLREDGKSLPYDEMQQRVKREVLDLSASFAVNHATGRCELRLGASGNDPAESALAVSWLRRMLLHADWDPANLPRLRDVVDQALSDLRESPEGYPETWVENVSNAYRSQRRPVLLATDSIFARIGYAVRMRWLLKEAPPGAAGEATGAFLEALARVGSTARREDLKALAAALRAGRVEGAAVPGPGAETWKLFTGLPAPAQAVAREVGKDLELLLPDIPDSTLGQDWAALCRTMRADLMVPPTRVLAELRALRDSLLVTGGARLVLTSSSATRQSLQPSLAALVGDLRRGPALNSQPEVGGGVLARMRQHEGADGTPVLLGFVWPRLSEGVIIYDAPGTGYEDLSEEKVLRFLAVSLHTGGAQSLASKAWAAGLAYSCGLYPSLADHRVHLYADNAPDLGQFLRLARKELTDSPRDPAQAQCALAQAFGSREADSYESRGAAMAANLADGITPDKVRGFRQAILALRARHDLSDALYDRALGECGRVVPGLGIKLASVSDGQFLVIGNDALLKAYGDQMKATEGPETKLWRLYPRDFWVAAPVAP